MNRGLVVASALLLTSACIPPAYIAPKEPIARSAVEVQAPFDRVWDSVIDALAAQVIPIETIDKASGVIVASTPAIRGATIADSSAALALADCGHVEPNLTTRRMTFLPHSAKYNVSVRSVRPDATTVRVTAAFVSLYEMEVPARALGCVSTGAIEARLEAAVKSAAERVASARGGDPAM